jgi:putative ABC transport system permease protein
MNLASLAARNVLRNKFRTVLTVLGVAVAILTFVLLRTVLGAWQRGAEFAPKDRIVTRNKVTFVISLPKRYIEDIRHTPGVKQATWSNWFGGKDPKHEREFFATIAVDTSTFFEVYDEIVVPPDQKAAFLQNRRSAIVGELLAKKLGYKVGDKVTLESGIFGNDPANPWTFDIAGIYTSQSKSADRSQFLFHWDYFNDNLAPRFKDKIGWVTSRTDTGGNSAQMATTIDNVFAEKEMPTWSADEYTFRNSFLASVSAILRALDIISVVILVIMMLILGNTIAMGVRERTNEYGVLRALGFLPKHIVGFIMGEAMLTGLLGGGVGLLLAYPLIEGGMRRAIEENMGQFFPQFGIPAAATAAAAVLSLVLGAAAAVLPAYQASKLKVVDALRRVA